MNILYIKICIICIFFFDYIMKKDKVNFIFKKFLIIIRNKK